MSEQGLQEVKDLINCYLDAYNTRDLDALKKAVSNDETLMAYGTDEGEIWHGWNEFKESRAKLFHAVEEISWKRGKPVITLSGDETVAWFAEELFGHFTVSGEEHKCPIRFTGVAVKNNNEWRIVQLHKSVAVEGFSVPYLEAHGFRFD